MSPKDAWLLITDIKITILQRYHFSSAVSHILSVLATNLLFYLLFSLVTKMFYYTNFLFCISTGREHFDNSEISCCKTLNKHPNKTKIDFTVPSLIFHNLFLFSHARRRSTNFGHLCLLEKSSFLLWRNELNLLDIQEK